MRPLQENDARRAQLVAAAEALVTWIHARRATWPELPGQHQPRSEARPDLSPPMAAPLAPIAEAIGPAPPIPPPFRFEPEASPAADVEQPAARRRTDSNAWTGVRRAAAALFSLVARLLGALGRRFRPLMAPLAGGVRRLAPYAAAAAVVLGAGWLARPYWPIVTARVAALMPSPETAIQEPPEPAATGAATGALMVRSDPSGARVSVDGKPLGVTPLDVDGLSFGRHTVVIEADQGSVRRTVTVGADGPALVSESIHSGFLKVFAPFDLQITADARAIRLDDQNQALLPPGSYQLQLENRALGYRETRRVDVIPGQTTTLSIVPPPSSLTVTANVASVVSIDGEPAGPTPLIDHPIALGTRDIVVRSVAGEERRYTRRVTVAAFQIVVEF